MKSTIILVVAIVAITSAFAGGTADNFSNIQNNRAAQIEAAVDGGQF